MTTSGSLFLYHIFSPLHAGAGPPTFAVLLAANATENTMPDKMRCTRLCMYGAEKEVPLTVCAGMGMASELPAVGCLRKQTLDPVSVDTQTSTAFMQPCGESQHGFPSA